MKNIKKAIKTLEKMLGNNSNIYTNKYKKSLAEEVLNRCNGNCSRKNIRQITLELLKEGEEEEDTDEIDKPYYESRIVMNYSV